MKSKKKKKLSLGKITIQNLNKHEIRSVFGGADEKSVKEGYPCQKVSDRYVSEPGYGATCPPPVKVHGDKKVAKKVNEKVS